MKNIPASLDRTQYQKKNGDVYLADILTALTLSIITSSLTKVDLSFDFVLFQGSASTLLASLEREKELLRIFLKVSQMENTILRRMNLSSFLMVS